MRLQRSTALGVACISFSLAATFVGLFWTPYDPLEMDPDISFARPSMSHLFGTDVFGRDVLSNIMVGARSTLLVALLSVGIGVVIGASVGIAAAISRRRFRQLAVFGIDIVLALPSVLFAIVLAAVYGASTQTATVAIGVALSAAIAQVTRRETSRVLRSDFVAAARISGSNTKQIIKLHVLPNIVASLFVQASGAIAIAILAESTLSYLGLGTTPPTPSWGRMLAESQKYLLVDPIIALWPGLAIVLTVLGFNLVGDSLREALDPTLKKSNA
jgi:peptide/nickel transport system permease protein